MDNLLHITLLFDFYSELLTDKQKEFFRLYHFDDLSLNEIAEKFDITPQGVRDLLKRTEKILFWYESKLNLLEKHFNQKEKVSLIIHLINKLNLDTENKNLILTQLENLSL